MQLYLQMAFKENPKSLIHLQENSYYFKALNRSTIDFKKFNEDMKVMYKERITDKINSVVDNIDIINSVLNVLK